MASRALSTLLLWAVVTFLAAPETTQAADYYLSRMGSDKDPATWAGAWHEMDQVDWSRLGPGDSLIVDGGSSGMTYSTRLTTAKDGTKDLPITIKRSTEAGHNGTVTMKGQIKIWSRYITLDGLDAARFVIVPDDPMCALFVGYWSNDATGAQVRNLTINGSYATASGISCSVYSPDCTISGVTFDRSNGEDMLAVMTNGNLTVENCTFRNLVGSGRQDCHRDAISTYPGTGPGSIFTVRGNKFINNKTDNFTVFPDQGAELGGFEITANYFDGCNTCVHFDDRLRKADFIRVRDNKYHNVQNFLHNNSPVSIEQSGNTASDTMR